MPNQHCFATVEICYARFSLLTSAGAPDPGASNGYVTDAIIEGTIGVELSEGTDIEKKSGCGAILHSLKRRDRIKRATLGLELGHADMQIATLTLGGTEFTSGAGHTVGWQPPLVDAADPPPVCAEVWTKAWDGAEQAVPAFTSPDVAYFHWVFPFWEPALQPLTLAGEEIVGWNLEGASQENSSLTSNGPFNDWPSAISGRGGITACFGVFLEGEDDLPTAACGYQAVPSGS